MCSFYDIIIKPNTERYRSGYNGTVLKTVVRQRTVGSNPTLSAIFKITFSGLYIFKLIYHGEVPKW